MRFAGEDWLVDRPLGPDAVLLRNARDEIISADPARIELLLSEDAGGQRRLVAESHHSEADWAKATQRRDVLLALSRLPSRNAADIAAAARTLGLNVRRVWALLQQGKSNNFEVVDFLHAASGPRPKRLDKTVETITAQAIEQHYAKTSRPSLGSLHTDILQRCQAANLAPPSYHTIRARVAARDQIWLTRRRHGPKAARALRLLTGAHPGAPKPWARVQIDSTPCDIRLVSEIDRQVISRATATFALDIYSRALLGFSCSLESASTLTVATCLAQACRQKDEWLARRELSRLHWPIYGIPDILEYDQGSENIARGIQRGLKLHGIKPKIRPKGHPEQHGHIERLIGTMMRAVHELPGATFSNINERGEAEPDKLACLSVTELERVLAITIDSYNHTTHATTGERPIEKYLSYYRQPNLPDAERIPPRPAENFLLDFLPYEMRVLRRTGFRLFRVDYSSVDLLPLWRHDNGKQVARVIVYNPNSLAQIWVADETNGQYLVAPYRTPHPDMNLAESAELRSSLHASKARDRGEARLFENLSETRAIVAKAKSTTMRRKAERAHQARQAAQEAAPKPAPIISIPPANMPVSGTPQPAQTRSKAAWEAADVTPFTDVERS
ncbi:transposase [Acidocella aquatica]|uniref:Transposase n=1 Tax=Acidocella aquatica TaxID=1922313 RepID=A0ABQ6A9Z9_9PROT|nr:Mu transposase C-terminal domain-containing protein [Acidocella aquatica]GLR68220.1 transposase [Acidocella aquatica]